ncbi:hypothetical protein CLIB1423_04S00782 [[Candida] railenensis]|uniref:Tyrosine specific protein phosphatases domain-containing protein n=1 Tax=[Candida] railenensis TaxID=45579 RepID=A0A9P0VWQ3_9ASCO|nr:hypothetical protein CLIB1423_04S00782 [[Candida] railenensis]
MVKEIEVTVGPTGVKGTLTIPPSVEDDDALGKGYAPATLKCALILHGQSGHRNYCYQRLLAHGLATELGIYSLRIDFRGCGDSPDVPDPKVNGRTIDLDVDDIQHCVEFLVNGDMNPLGLSFTLSSIIGHSRGSLAMFLWAFEQNRLLSSVEHSSKAIIVPNLVNCSARYRSNTVWDRYPSREDGFIGVDQTCLRHGKFQPVWVSVQEIESIATPNLDIMSELSTEMSVLSIYGLSDHIIPIEDSAYYANTLSRGSKKSHELVLIPRADHNFYGDKEILTETDQEEYNPENLPLNSKKLVNFNHSVVRHILDYLRADKEFERFWYNSLNIGHLSRWKNIEGISNFRDIGGWHAMTPPKGLKVELLPNSEIYVRPKIVFRCANTANVTGLGLKEMQSLGVKVMFDLRSDGECRKDGTPKDLAKYGITRIHAPCFTKEDYSPQAVALRYTNLMTSWHTYVHVYDKLLSEATGTFRIIFQFIRDDLPKGNGFVFHCTAGKDRTGVLAMLILLLAGVDKHTVSKEYELTTYGLMPDHEAIKGKFVETIKKTKEKLAAVGSTLDYEETIRQGRENWTLEEDGFNNLISSRYEAMLSTIELLETKYGGIIGYMKEWLKFTDDDLVKIYKNLVHIDNFGGFEDSSFITWDHRPNKAKI